jgi:hypothetical protein
MPSSARILALTIVLLGALSSADAHDPINSSVTWNGDIERIVHARCTACHIEGGRGPMSLARYEDARPWARAIREEVLARRMPKWHAARGYGQFANDRSLTPFEIALVVAWVDGGAVRGPKRTGEEALPEVTAHNAAPDARLRTVRCGERALPRGRLLGLRPRLDEGGSAGISVVFPDGSREIVAWIRGFEKKFEETYWLQDPIALPSGATLSVESTGGCTIQLALAR